MTNRDIFRYVSRRIAVKNPEIAKEHCFDPRLEEDSLGKKERDKLAVNSLTPNEIWEFCDKLEEE